MRITNNMLVRTMMLNLNNNLNRMDTVQQQMSTGKKIQVPSDDPIIAARSLKFRTDVSEIEQFKKNTGDATSWLETTETALSNLGNVVQRARDLTVEAANGTLGIDDKQKIKSEISQLKKSLIEIGNTTYASRYVFAGFKTNKAPFEVENVAGVGEKLLYSGKYLSPGGPVSASVNPTDYENFYESNLNKIAGQPELMMGNFQAFTAATPALDFNVSLNGTTNTISMDDGVQYTLPPATAPAVDITGALQTKLDSAFGAAMIKVGSEDGRLKLTVLQGDKISMNTIPPVPPAVTSPANAFDIKKLGFVNGASSVRDQKQEIEYQIGLGSSLDINVEGTDIFGKGTQGLYETFTKLEMALDGQTTYLTATESAGSVTVASNTLDLSGLLEDIDVDINRLLKARADNGAKMNFVELTDNRLQDDFVNFTGLMSKNEDADMAEVIMNLKNEENVYRASLSAGAKIIQPTLLDFLR